MLGGALSGCLAPEDDETLGEAGAFVVHGTADTTANAVFPASVRINGQACSGTLVTPYWVMTAEHCYQDPGDVSGTDNVWLGASANPGMNDPGDCESDGTPAFCKRQHSLATSGPVWTWPANGHRETDLALVRLDAPAPVPWARPAHPPLTALACGAFQGQLVGYGPIGYNENGYACNGTALGTRRFGSSVAWNWDDGNYTGSTHRHVFTSDPFEGCTDMTGIGVGWDSGGSLYRASDGQFCGVISGDGYWACTGSNTSNLSCDYHTVAVDDPNAIAWFSQYILDVDNYWEGETPVTAQNDPDGDGIPWSDDNCPQVWNPEQLNTFDDPDGNGLGAACDACPGIDGLSQYANRNKEVELAIGYPTATSYPVLKRSDYASDAAFIAARTAYLAAFVPDACDPYPAPLATLQSGGDLPSSVSEPTPDFVNWPCMAYTGGCDVVTKNKIKITPLSSPVVDAAGGTNERIGLRWCDCQFAAGFANSLAGRALCRTNFQSDCQYNETRYGESNSKWLKLTTKNGSNWSNPLLGAEWNVAAGSAPFGVTWDFAALGPTHVTGSTNNLSVKGMLWTHVDQLLNVNVPLTQANVRKYANALGDGGAHRSYGPDEHLWVAINDWIECPMCDAGLEQIVLETTNPWWHRVTPEGLDLVEVVDPATRAHFDSVGAGTRLHVAASEPVATLSRMYAPGVSYVRALGLGTNGSVASKLVASGLEAVPVAQPLAAPGGPTFVRGEGLAFSALGQRLYVLGGVTAGGQPRNAGWFLDLPTSTWRQFPMPAGETVGEVLGMTYRHQDRAIYFLDKSGSTLRLRRWHAQRKLSSGVLITLATFPSGWNGFGRYTVVAGPRGDVAQVAWNGTGSEKTRIGRFTLTAAHRLERAGLSKLTTPVLAPPAMTPSAFAMTVDPSRPTASKVAFSSMVTDWRADAPTVLQH